MSANFKPHKGIVNATVNDGNLQKQILKDKHASGEGVRQFVKESRCHNAPGTKRNLPHTLPLEESYNEDGSTVSERPTTKTKRTSH